MKWHLQEQQRRRKHRKKDRKRFRGSASQNRRYDPYADGYSDEEEMLITSESSRKHNRPVLRSGHNSDRTFNIGGFAPRPNRRPSVDCDFYTSDICLDVANYPSQQIISLLNSNRRAGSDLVAEVIDQSADELIDGVTSSQENAYTYSHYYGQRRDDGIQVQRDFAQDGGFLCPSGSNDNLERSLYLMFQNEKKINIHIFFRDKIRQTKARQNSSRCLERYC